MEVAIISPISMLKEFSVRSKWQMALAQHVLADQDYGAFFRVQHNMQNDYVILDNGTAEGEAATLDELAQAVRIAQPNEIILPDVWQDGKATIALLEEAIPKLGWDRRKLQAVAQGASAFEWLWCFFKLVFNERVDVIGIPKNLDKVFAKTPSRATGLGQWFGRVGVVNWLVEICDIIGYHKPFHLLGIWTDYRELALYSNQAKRYVRSVDTSSPVHCGLDGIRYPGPRGSYREPNYPMNFQATMPIQKDLVFRRIHDNIDELFQVAEAKDVRPRES